MDDFEEKERAHERDRYSEKMDHLHELETQSMGKLLKSESQEQSQEGLFEHVLVMLAHWQIQSQDFRIENKEDGALEDSVEVVKEYIGYMNSITQDGDWSTIKKYYGSLNSDLQIPSRAREMGIDPNFTYKGERIFSHDDNTTKYDTDGQYDAWREFLLSKLSLIPDKTSPYQYPKLEVLKAKIASV